MKRFMKTFLQRSIIKIKRNNLIKNIIRNKTLVNKNKEEKEIDINLLRKNESQNIFEAVKNSYCKGCGVNIQINDPYEEGYMDYKKFYEYLKNKLKLESLNSDEKLQKDIEQFLKSSKNNFENPEEENMKNRTHNIEIDNNTNINDLENLEKNYFSKFWKNVKINGLNCLRCIKLKENNINDLLEMNLNFQPVKKEILLNKIFKRINNESCIVLVLDINDLIGSFNEDLILKINKKNLDYIIVINKIDTIPENVNTNNIKNSILKNLENIEMKEKLLNLDISKLVLVSSKSGEGIKNLIKILKEKSKIKKSQKIQRKLFFLGSINSGKSSLINTLQNECQRQKK